TRRARRLLRAAIGGGGAKIRTGRKIARSSSARWSLDLPWYNSAPFMLPSSVTLLLVFLIVLANGVFVAAEFALVSVRRARIEMLAAGGTPGAKAVLRALNHLDALLSS